MKTQNRREFIQKLATLAGGAVLFPFASAAGSAVEPAGEDVAAHSLPLKPPGEAVRSARDLPPVPLTKPADWDPIAFNRRRGNAGAIPSSYLDDINGPDGENKHLGKHLPYIPKVDMSLVPEGFIPLMFGDPSLGYTPHPNAVPGPDNNNEGHWFNWIQIRRATGRWQVPVLSTYTSWPVINPEDSGRFGIYGKGQLTDADGTRTIYLAQLPADAHRGCLLRIWAHCLTHGEYVDFVRM